MSIKKSGPGTGPPSQQSSFNHTAQFLARELAKHISQHDLKKPLIQRERAVLWLVIAAEHNMKVTRFDAAVIGVTALNSAVPKIQEKNLLIIDRRPTKRPTRFSKATDCHEYWLQGASLKKAQKQCERVLLAKSCEVA